MLRLLPLILLAACTTHTTVLPPEAPAQSCPEAAPVIIAPPKPVWPDSCVADWYANASLPACVETYLHELKAQQKTIAKKRGGR